jgi:hypothetical protein
VYCSNLYESNYPRTCWDGLLGKFIALKEQQAEICFVNHRNFEIVSPIKLIPTKPGDKALDTKKLEIKVSGQHDMKVKDFRKEGEIMIWDVEDDIKIPIYK